jgi:hypothetical protein
VDDFSRPLALFKLQLNASTFNARGGIVYRLSFVAAPVAGGFAMPLWDGFVSRMVGRLSVGGHRLESLPRRRSNSRNNKSSRRRSCRWNSEELLCDYQINDDPQLRANPSFGSLLLGLYDADGLLHHVGFTSTIKTRDKPALTKKLKSLIGPPGFTGNAPGGPSRWSTKRSSEWEPLRPTLVVESATITSAVIAFAMARGCCAGVPTKRPSNVRWCKSGSAKLM